jgi:hypothetical protein
MGENQVFKDNIPSFYNHQAPVTDPKILAYGMHKEDQNTPFGKKKKCQFNPSDFTQL